MHDSVEDPRLRWTPELTAAAVRLLQGHPPDVKIPAMEHDGATCLDLRGIRIEDCRLDFASFRKCEITLETIRFLAVVEGVAGITVLGMLIASWTKKIMYR